MDELMENEAFVNGIAVGVHLHQQRVIQAHKRKEPIRIGDEWFWLQSGRERLEEMLNRICK